ncbi:hypothetical protein [Spirulina sp. 06S082]|uniref:hypothetical protein n=1 Tax=Spirulina sp. 06S082 TaxID=3110248 RepID=UPI002B217156|nr:hypothetical protein [Spirulina sp. 06S082]MEA5468905.1 hypothetical protein [Spirulina sp. 06S082]
MNEKPEKQDSARSHDPLIKDQKTNFDLVSLTDPTNNAIDENIVQRIKEAQTPEEVEQWLQAREQLEIQKERRIQNIEQEKNNLQERRLKIFDEIRLTVFSGLLFSLGVSMVFLKLQQPGLVLIIIGSLKPLKYSIPEISKLLGKISKNISVLAYLFTLIFCFFAILIWADISEGIQQALIIFISLTVLFSLSVIKYILETSQLNNTIEDILDRNIENED